MDQRTSYQVALSFIGGLLTLAASGDDFNVMRVLLPATFAHVPTGSLPLDDQNSDFLRPVDAAGSERTTSSRPDAPVRIGWQLWTPVPVSGASDPYLGTAHPREELASHHPSLTPLRC